MKILLTNDDGVHAPGLEVLEAIAREFSDDIWICAPDEEQSGMGHALTLTRPVRLRQYGERRFAVTEGMADPGEGKVYELWLDHDGEMVAAGFMPKGPDNTVLLSGDAAAAEGVGITVEPEGGSDEPNLDTAVVFAFDA